MKVNLNARNSTVGVKSQRVDLEVVQQPLVDHQKELEVKVDRVFKNHLLPASLATGILSAGKMAFAATGGASGLADKLMPIVNMLQDFALPVGIIVSIWGLLEIMIGNPGGKTKIKMAVIGFAGIFVIPEVFYAIRGAFRA